MMKIFINCLFLVMVSYASTAQQSYTKYISKYRKDYVKKHEVVTGKSDKKYFRFFPADALYKVEARYTPETDTVGFMMPTSSKKMKKFFRYGRLDFELNGKALQLQLYRNHALMTDSVYKNHIFLPFTDLTSGEESYGGGRYIDLETTDIVNNRVVIDFNKAYNPYCNYSDGYNCPLPPRENDLPVAIRAGEQNFAKSH
jgi:uncharacterized protein (DUF1684 family)